MRVIELLFLAVLASGAQTDFLVDGLSRFQRGDYLGAEASLVRALEAGDEPRARVFLALARAATGRCPTAGPVLEKEFAGNSDATLRRLAGLGAVQCRLARGDYDGAYPLVAKLRELAPSDPDVLYQAARLHMRAWNDTIYQMFQRAPASYRVNQISAEIFEIQGKFAEAVAEYRKAIEKNPAALNLHYRLGRAILMESHTPEALEKARQEFEAELALNPNDAVAEYQVAQILLAQQRPAEAKPRLERAVALQPEFSEALVALARLLLDEKKTDEAIALLERAVKAAPRSEPARYNLMRAYRNAGRLEEAKRQQEELKKLQQPPAGEFTEFLKKLGEQAPQKQP
jgi:tetratricopeptide (TPR) repeat protein